LFIKSQTKKFIVSLLPPQTTTY